MGWRITQAESRARYLTKYDAVEVELYDSWIRTLTRDDDLACLQDILDVFSFRDPMTVLDAGAGTGAMCKVLSHVPGLSLTALEPSPAMLAKLKEKPELREIATVEGFCDADEDRLLFPTASFDVIISRQLVNGLYDPLKAFQNWHDWLKPGGTALILDGLYDRSAWTGRWEEEIDVLPMSACRNMAMAPYLLEFAGYRIGSVMPMLRTNAMPSTPTTRYLVVASKPNGF